MTPQKNQRRSAATTAVQVGDWTGTRPGSRTISGARYGKFQSIKDNRWAVPWWAMPLWVLALSLTTMWPFWMGLYPRERYAFALRDMMVPFNLFANDLAFGTTGSPARAIPQDTVLAIISPIIPATLMVSLMVIVASIVGGINAARMVRDMAGARPLVQFAASAFVLWNPYVLERFLQGQWAMSIAAMLLPAVAYYSASRRRGPQLISLAGCALVPSGIVLGLAIALLFDQTWRDRAASFLASLMCMGPWLLVSLINTTDAKVSAESAGLFAARAEAGVGTLGGLMGLGGIWNAEALPPSRGLVSTVAGVLLCVILFYGFIELSRVYRCVAIATVAAIAIPALTATPWGISIMGWLINTIPGAGILRDTQKFVALAIPGMLLMMAVVVESLALSRPNPSALHESTPPTSEDKPDEAVDPSAPAPAVPARRTRRGARFRMPGQTLARIGGMLMIVLIFLGAPGFPKDMKPLKQVELTSAWSAMINVMSAAPSGQVLLLPPGSYRRIDDRPVIDPALKLLPGAPLDPGFLVVDDKLVDGDPHTLNLLRQTMSGKDELAQNGVGWVVVDWGSMNPHQDYSAVRDVLRHHRKVVSRDGLELYRVANSNIAPNPHSQGPIWVGLAMYWITWALGLWLSLWSWLSYLTRSSGPHRMSL